MKRAVILVLLIVIPAVIAYECPPGTVWSRGVIGCVQEKCPPGSGRLYSEACSCWTSEWGGTPKVTCSENGLATHCLPEGGKCEENPSPWDPITGQCKSGYTLNADKTSCVAGTSGTTDGGSSTPSPPSSQTTPDETGTSGTSPPPAQTEEQYCASRPNMQYVNGKCTCATGYLQDLQRKGCVTPEQLEAQCDFILDARYDPATKKCVCENPKEYPSGYSWVCENAQTFGDQVCNNRYMGAVYSATDKKCTCPPGTTTSPDKKSCTKPGAIGAACSDTKPCPNTNYACVDGTCACSSGYRASVDGKSCVTQEEYGNEACPQRYPGSVYDAANKKCSCPAGTTKSPDGKSCIKSTAAGAACDTNSNCTQTTSCDPTSKTCKEVPCECGEVKDHKCEAYACCDDTKCANDEKCDTTDHKCTKVDCPTGTIRNHECNPGDCDNDNNKCPDDKKCEANTCTSITCDCGKIENHACTPYECCQDTQCTTPDTACDTNEHKCKPVEVCKHVLNSGDSTKFDLVFVPDKYTAAQKGTFESDVRKIYDKLIDMEPFKSNRNKINVHRVEKFDQNLNCNYQQAPLDPAEREQWRLLVCDAGKATTLASKCPADNVMVVVNSAQYGGSGGSVAVSYNGDVAIGVLVHELGHMLGLDDEYSYGTNAAAGKSPRANCDSSNTCTKWNAVAGTSCNQKCSYENWYRSTPGGDIMLDNTNNLFFRTVSQNHIKTILAGYR